MENTIEYVTPVTKRYAAVATAVALPYYLHFPEIISFAEGARLGAWRVSDAQTFYWLNFTALVFSSLNWAFRARRDLGIAYSAKAVKQIAFDKLVDDLKELQNRRTNLKNKRAVPQGSDGDNEQTDPALVNIESQILELNSRLNALRSNEAIIKWQSRMSYIDIPAGIIGASIILTVFDVLSVDLTNLLVFIPISVVAVTAILLEFYRLSHSFIVSGKSRDPLSSWMRLVIDDGAGKPRKRPVCPAVTRFLKRIHQWIVR